VNVWTKRKRFEKLRYLHRNQHLEKDAARKAEFQSLHHRRRRTLLRFADQQMKVLGHDHVAEDDELIPLSYLLQNSEKQVAPPRTAEQRLALVTTAGDEMQVAISIVARQVPRHGNERSGVEKFAL
jgi:hypothetical protein